MKEKLEFNEGELKKTHFKFGIQFFHFYPIIFQLERQHYSSSILLIFIALNYVLSQWLNGIAFLLHAKGPQIDPPWVHKYFFLHFFTIFWVLGFNSRPELSFFRSHPQPWDQFCLVYFIDLYVPYKWQ